MGGMIGIRLESGASITAPAHVWVMAILAEMSVTQRNAIIEKVQNMMATGPVPLVGNGGLGGLS